MVSYVINKRSAVIHKLPASESCNTDQIAQKERFEIHASEEVVSMIPEGIHFCRRCFPDAD